MFNFNALKPVFVMTRHEIATINNIYNFEYYTPDSARADLQLVCNSIELI
mgnify:CR=1 FL=1